MAEVTSVRLGESDDTKALKDKKYDVEAEIAGRLTAVKASKVKTA